MYYYATNLDSILIKTKLNINLMNNKQSITPSVKTPQKPLSLRPFKKTKQNKLNMCDLEYEFIYMLQENGIYYKKPRKLEHTYFVSKPFNHMVIFDPPSDHCVVSTYVRFYRMLANHESAVCASRTYYSCPANSVLELISKIQNPLVLKEKEAKRLKMQKTVVFKCHEGYKKGLKK